MGRRGIALLSVAGLLAALAALAVAVGGQMRVALASFPPDLVAAGLAGASGMEYAAARLDGNPFPGHRDPFSRGDDWSAGPAAYPHGDGDGGASGRLRPASSFALSVRGLDGCVPLNAGAPRPQDRCGAAAPPHGPNGVPDHRDLAIPIHRGLAHLLNNLGAILDLSRAERVATGAPAGAGETFALSWLGNDLVSRRPPDGYRRWEDVATALTGAGYDARDAARVRPFLDWAPVEGFLQEGGRALGNEDRDFPATIPVNALAAPREVLAALWMHVAGDIPLSFTGFGEAWGWRKPCTRTGPAGRPGTLSFGTLQAGQSPVPLTPVIFRDEAEELADRLVALRGAGPLSWDGIRRMIVAGATGNGGIFRRDWNDLMRAPDPALVLARAWTHFKAQIAWQAIALDPAPFSGTACGSAAWACGGIDHDPATPAAEPFPVLGYDTPAGGILRIRYPEAPGGWPSWQQPFTSREAGDRILTPGLSLAPPCRFRVESRGASLRGRASSSGVLRIGSVLVLASQEDFENLDGGRRLARRGIIVTDDPAPLVRRDVADDGSGRVYPQAATVPRWSRRAVSPDGRGPDLYGASRMFGAVTLATREAGLRGARLYWPFSEDADGRLDNGGAWTSGPARDFWHEIDPAWTGAPPAGPFPAALAWTPPRPDDPYLTPLLVTGHDGSIPGQAGAGVPFRIECPGLSGPDGAPAPGFTLSCWMGTGSRIGLESDSGDKLLSLATRRTGSDPLSGETEFALEALWAGRSLRTAWTVPDGDLDGRVSWAYHVVLVWGPSATEPGKSDFRLFVNGSDEEDFGPERVAVLDGPCLAAPLFALTAARVDEVRLHDAPLARNAAASLYGDRFVRRASWRSPLHAWAWGGPVRFREVAWHGVRPADFPADPFRVRMRVYGDASGAAERPGSPAEIPGTAGGRDARLTGRAMRFEVALDCGAVAGILDDAPFFESFWLRVSPAGGGARWEEREDRGEGT